MLSRYARFTGGLLVLLSLLVAYPLASAQQPGNETPVMPPINTDGWTDSPFMTADGQQLYFMYTPYNFYPWFTGGIPEQRGPDRPGHQPHPDGNPWGDSDLYVATRLPDGSWGPASAVSVNDAQADACPMVLPDGQALYWQKGTESADIFVAYRTPDGDWGAPIDLGSPVNQPDSHEVNPHVSADDQTLWFSSDRSGGYGGMDLYISHRQPDGTWGEPINLGPNINTADGEDQIWVSPDGQTAYFNRDLTLFVMRAEGTGWSVPEEVYFEGQSLLLAEASLTADGNYMIIAVPDIPNERLIIMESQRLPDGTWGLPTPIREATSPGS